MEVGEDDRSFFEAKKSVGWVDSLEEFADLRDKKSEEIHGFEDGCGATEARRW
jgi:hypothetical protein